MQAIRTKQTETARVNSATVRATSRFAPPALAAAAGWPAVIAVSIAGITAGFFAWYAVISRAPHGPVFMEVAFLAALILGIGGSLCAWHFYAQYFSRRTDIPYATALRYDAITWVPLVLMWAAFVSPIAASATGRAIALAIGLFVLAKISVAAYFNRTVRDVSLTFLTTRISIIVIAELAAIVVGQRPGTHYAASANPMLAVWGRWDAEHYIGIAEQGYHVTEVAFFPLYPLLIRIVGSVTGSHLIAGLLISNIASFFGLLFFYKLVEHQFNRQVAHRATFYISIFPTSVFFSAVYTESLFFALTVASFYYIREHRWMTAGAIGALAALTRAEGILLIAPYCIELLSASGQQAWYRSIRGAICVSIGGFLIFFGLFLYMVWLWVLRGDPLYFSHLQSHW